MIKTLDDRIGEEGHANIIEFCFSCSIPVGSNGFAIIIGGDGSECGYAQLESGNPAGVKLSKSNKLGDAADLGWFRPRLE